MGRGGGALGERLTVRRGEAESGRPRHDAQPPYRPVGCLSVSDWLSETELAQRLESIAFVPWCCEPEPQPAWHVPPDAGRPGREAMPRRVPDVAWAPGVHVTICHRITTIR
ncbi:hypothetical protein GCM10017771_19980 [Streptomyces capitiformicae]|uniref:Uncharacterized protein n=1 Tax=Streptomyces capitiformicae TaxID=2014920 RepID=A0A919L7Q0_9ACTN|nr:hypothetical protein GCM10017771_19980 [Streptomyces capitiformicae]